MRNIIHYWCKRLVNRREGTILRLSFHPPLFPSLVLVTFLNPVSSFSILIYHKHQLLLPNQNTCLFYRTKEFMQNYTKVNIRMPLEDRNYRTSVLGIWNLVRYLFRLWITLKGMIAIGSGCRIGLKLFCNNVKLNKQKVVKQY